MNSRQEAKAMELTRQDNIFLDMFRGDLDTTEKDIQKFEELTKKAKSKLPEIKRKSLELGLMMKFISAEYSLNESKVLITFSSEERVDFRGLLKELATMFKTRIELKQVGQRGAGDGQGSGMRNSNRVDAAFHSYNLLLKKRYLCKIWDIYTK